MSAYTFKKSSTISGFSNRSLTEFCYVKRVDMSKHKKECTLFWFIENYSYWRHNRGEKLISPIFTTDGLEGTAWHIEIYPRGFSSHNKEIYVYVCRNEDEGPSNLKTNVHLSFVAKDGSTLLDQETVKGFSKRSEYGWCVKKDEFLSLRKSERLPKNILAVKCNLWIGGGIAESEKMPPICARTRIGIEHISFFHTIDGFSKFDPNKKGTVHIRCRSKGRGGISSSIYSCCKENIVIQIKTADTDKILCKYRVFLLDKHGNLIKCAEEDNRFDYERKKIEKLSLSLTKDAIISHKSDYLPKDKLSLLCEYTFCTGIEFQQIERAQSEITTTDITKSSSYSHIEEKLNACPSALDELKHVFDNKFLTDVVLQTKTNSFPAHKILLCARSPVFNVMLSSDMKEKIFDSIQIDDLEDDTLQQLLLFLYSDSLEALQWDTATKLYYAADKYQIEKLRLVCSSFLIDHLSVMTVPELLLLADTHNDRDLKKVVEDFILRHNDEVFSSENWRKLAEANSQLAVETMLLKYTIEKKG